MGSRVIDGDSRHPDSTNDQRPVLTTQDYRLRLVDPPKIEPRAPLRIARPIPDPSERTALFEAASTSPS